MYLVFCDVKLFNNDHTEIVCLYLLLGVPNVPSDDLPFKVVWLKSPLANAPALTKMHKVKSGRVLT